MKLALLEFIYDGYSKKNETGKNETKDLEDQILANFTSSNERDFWPFIHKYYNEVLPWKIGKVVDMEVSLLNEINKDVAVIGHEALEALAYEMQQ